MNKIKHFLKYQYGIGFTLEDLLDYMDSEGIKYMKGSIGRSSEHYYVYEYNMKIWTENYFTKTDIYSAFYYYRRIKEKQECYKKYMHRKGE